MTMNLLQMSFYGAVLILVIAAVRAIAINKLPKKTFLILWGIAMVRLLIPYELPSVLSVYSLVGSDTPAAAVEETEVNYENYSPVLPAVSFEPSEKNMPFEPSAPSAPKTQIPPLSSETGGFGSVWFVIWLSGAILLAAFFTLSYLRCYFEFKTSLPVENEFTRQWLIEHKIKRPLSIRQSDKITVPLTYGVFRPVILMPKQTDWKNTKQLRYVLLHEYVHVCRFDAFLKLICVFVLCLHWFNPAIWLMYALFNRDIELTCDECVVKKSGLNIKAEYALMLIGTEEKKAGLMPLCSGFGKNCAKERIVAVMKIKKMSALAVAAAVILTAGVTATFATSAFNFQEDKPNIADTDFSDNELEKMLALKFEGYEKMSVSEFQNKVWELTDTKEYRDLFERFSTNEALYETRDEDKAAYFIYNILFPLTRDNWQENRFDRCTVSDYEGTSDSAILEYTITLTIQNANTLTVGEYDTARLNMISGISEFIWDCTPEQLRNEEFMREAINLKFEELIQFLMKWFASDKLKISATFYYNPLVNLPTQASVNPILEGAVTRRYPNGSEEDYRSLLKLKTPDYQSMSLRDFNLSLLEWADEDYERTERIDEDTRYNDFSVNLDSDELSFITQSIYLSGRENAKHVQSIYTGSPEEDPSYSLQLPSKTAEKNGFAAWCDLYCEFSYHISDKETVTVGERDRCIGGIINGIRELWDKADIEDLLKMTKSDIVKKLNELAAEYGNENIAVTFSEDRVGFECMDEREEYGEIYGGQGVVVKDTKDTDFDWDWDDHDDFNWDWDDDDDFDWDWDDKALMEAYAAYGIKKDGKSFYYKGEPVYIIMDQRHNSSFYLFDINPKGTVSIKVIRNTEDKITGVSYMTEEEVEKLLPRLLDEEPAIDGRETTNRETAVFENIADPKIYEVYKPFGLTVNKADSKLYYNGKLVRCFDDQIPTGFLSVKAIGYYEKNGVIDVRAVRESSKLIGLEVSSGEEFNGRTIKEDVSSHDTASGTSIFDLYLDYGLEYDKTRKGLFYENKRVRLFWDSLSSDSKPSASESPFIVTVSNWDEKGTVDLYVVRDYRQKDNNGYGKITGLRIADQQEFDNNTSLFAGRNMDEREEHVEIYGGEIVDSFPFFGVKPGQYALSEAVYEISDTALFDYAVNWEPMGNYIQVGLISTDKSRVYSDSCISGRASGNIEVPSGSYYVMVYNEPSSNIDLNATVAYSFNK